MDSNELRALADALIECGEDAWPTPPEPIQRAAAYLRAQAEAQPVGYATANGLRMLQQDDATVLLYKHDYLIRPDHVPLYTHPAPAAPQAEPLSDKQLASVCMSYRHDFGLLDDAEQVRLLLEARAWEHAFRKEWQRC